MTDQPNPGYKNPPEKTRFKAGVSGNPSGRPKQMPSLQTELLHELGRPAGTSAGDVSNATAIAKSLVAAAVRGNLRATQVLFVFCAKQLSDANTQERSTTADSDILADFLDREIRRRQQQGEVKNPAETEEAKS